MKLLLVEDEEQLSEALVQLLKRNKYLVDAVDNGEDGLDCGLTGIYDAIVLDIMLPRLNGIEVLKRLRQNNISTPVMLLTAKGGVSDKVLGLDSGADDYLPKPFDPDEFLARIRALCRRKGDIISDDTLRLYDFSLNLSTYKLRCSDSEIKLTQKEVEILRYFMLRPGRVVNKEDLITKVWGYDSEADHNNIEVYISFIRKKLKHVNSKAKISTVRGIGYKLEK